MLPDFSAGMPTVASGGQVLPSQEIELKTPMDIFKDVFFDIRKGIDKLVQQSKEALGLQKEEDREKDIVFTIDMPGVSKKDINIEIEEHSIKVSAENGGKRKYNYSRKFKPAVDTESAKATFTNGVLDITVTKIESKPSGRKVAIK